MSDILGPTEVDAYRKIPHADFGVFRYSGLIATIDALAEALRGCALAEKQWLEWYGPDVTAKLARVAAWLEESNG